MTSYPRFDGTQACANLTPALVAAFDGVAEPARAVQICVDCAFLNACRGYAVDHDVVGVWGGTTGPERQMLRTAAGIPTPQPITAELDAMVCAWRSAAEVSRVELSDASLPLAPSLSFAS